MKAMTPQQLQNALGVLNESPAKPWTVRDGKLHKEFLFADFISAFGFMTSVAIHAEKVDHHPDWSNVYNRVTVDLVTHQVGGVTVRDFSLAKTMDEVADRGTLPPESDPIPGGSS